MGSGSQPPCSGKSECNLQPAVHIRASASLDSTSCSFCSAVVFAVEKCHEVKVLNPVDPIYCYSPASLADVMFYVTGVILHSVSSLVASREELKF